MTKEAKADYLPAEMYGERNPLLTARYPDNLVRRIGRRVLAVYMRLYHKLDVKFDPDIPKQGPALFVTNHDSTLTVPVLMVADPYYPQTLVPVKSESFEDPLYSILLRSWGAMSVNRDGKDRKAVSDMLNGLEAGRTLCIAPEGTRSNDGTLKPLDSSFVGFALICARRGYPVVPMVEIGTYQALPKSAKFPRPYPIRVRGGKPMDLSPWANEKATVEVKMALARYIQNEIAKFLPPEQRPRLNMPPMWDRKNYLPKGLFAERT